MKKTLLSIVMLAVAMAGFAADGKVHVKGELKNVGDTLLALTQRTMNQPATIVVKDGKFEFDFPTDEVTSFFIVSPGMLSRQPEANPVQMQLIAVPGETMELVGDVKSRFDINGSKFYKEYHEADLAMEAVNNEQSAMMEKANKMMAEQGQEAAQKFYSEQMPVLTAKKQNVILDFIKNHAASEAAAAIIPELQDLDKMKEAAALLSDEVKNGRMKAYYQNIIDRTEAQKKAEEEAAKKQAPGVQAPEFTLNDINGNPLALSSLRGKYVILDFWGSWCGWCIKGFPEMKNYYNKYKGKFEILGIDCNDTEQKWKDAVKKNELPWLHVYNPRSSKVLSDYGVQGFPTKIILGPDGKIVKTIVGEDPAFYTLLDELFGK
ncbi:MAG: AhpC/TSA family protein [Prevotella sp.]|nr:AhpC/TSA family protein [Prevotella sp.]